MKKIRIPSSTAARAVLGLGLTLGLAAAAPAFAAMSEAQTRYQQERAVCANGQSNQSRDTCLKEAGAAYAEARKGELGESATPDVRNASKRCKPLSGDERRDCMARMQGAGTTSGSAASGGILRELVTTEPAPAASAAMK
jgi:hypothetical protein